MKRQVSEESLAPFADGLTISPFCKALSNDWQGLSDILNQAYCREDSKVNLGQVCTNCSELEFMSAIRYPLNQKSCPVCSSSLVSFWAPFRTQYYFESAYNSFGAVAYREGEWQGMIWGYERLIDGINGKYWYMDMIIIPSSLWGLRKGIACCYALFKGIKEQASKKGYTKLLARTQVKRSPMKGMFINNGGKYIGLDPLDKERELWQFNL